MLVREIMTSPALSVHEDALIEEAVALMADRHITALPVVRGTDVLVGILSEMDILRYALPHDPRAHSRPLHADDTAIPLTVAEIMTETPRTTQACVDVADLIGIFTSSSIKSIPVVHGHHLIGVVSRSDIIRAMWRNDADLLDEVRTVFAEYGQGHWDVAVEHAVVMITGTGSPREREIAEAIARSVIGVRRVRHEPATQPEPSA